MAPKISISRRLRSTPFTKRVTENGVKSYTVYNNMLLPTVFRSLKKDYWHLCEHVQVWDVSVERQVQIEGPDAYKLIQLMTPRNLSQAKIGQCFYIPLCDENGTLINDPIAIKHSDDIWWLSIADSDVYLWAKGLATGFGLDVQVTEPDIWPLAIQGPKAEDLVARVFGESIRDIRFFGSKKLNYGGKEMLVARSGWSKQGGFEVYVNDIDLGLQLWDELFEKGADLNVGPGCPNNIERIESGLMSFGNDMDYKDTPYECGLEKYISYDIDLKSLSIKALHKHQSTRKLMGLVIDQKVTFSDMKVTQDDITIGEIRSQTWSPKYQAQLAFAMLDLAGIEGKTNVMVNTDKGSVKAKLASMPFNFEALGLTAHAQML
ncbi:MAG: dimethylsulfoniopropionate demethylase [Cocleimonas sp.]|jgi:dimethylsulfoniopropionate demethylase